MHVYEAHFVYEAHLVAVKFEFRTSDRNIYVRGNSLEEALNIAHLYIEENQGPLLRCEGIKFLGFLEN